MEFPDFHLFPRLERIRNIAGGVIWLATAQFIHMGHSNRFQHEEPARGAANALDTQMYDQFELDYHDPTTTRMAQMALNFDGNGSEVE